ncbi:MAG: hypothetical protein JNL28_13950 [Planctomycetes bacterium]|nr:hypothetical protein [Planctomycetota bacterium]
MQLSLILCALTTVVVSSASAADKKPADAPAQKGRIEKVDELGLTLTLPAGFGDLKPITQTEQVRAGWSGRIGASAFNIALFALPDAEFGFEEPEDVGEFIRDDFRKRVDASFAYEQTELLQGSFGYAPYAALGYGPTHASDGETVDGSYFVLGGLVEGKGYSLEVIAQPRLDEAGDKLVLEFLRKGVAYKGPVRNPQWTEAEVAARWAKDAPAKLQKKMEKPVRTKHYIFLSDTGAAKQMGDAMEKSYAAIQKMYPFPEVPGRRLMPVFLFTSQTSYYEFFAQAFNTTTDEAAATKGVAYGDFYATYYDAPQDPVHIHEMTHQIFANRLRLGGGGSWFQEGVAEYICTRDNERTDAANLVKKGRHVKLPELIAMPSLIASGADDVKEGNKAGSLYTQAALLIEFVRESKWSKDKFLDWVHAIGNCPDNNHVAIERATKAVLGVSLSELEEKYVEYCKKR